VTFYNKREREREREREIESDRAIVNHIKKQLLTKRIKKPDGLLVDPFFSDILRDKQPESGAKF
jgi:hypothetical protein